MMHKTIFAFAIICSTTFKFCTAFGGNLTLENSAPTNWGFWGNMELCPNGTFAAGMQLKVQGRQWSSDDTALNAIKLQCVDPFNHNSIAGTIMSTEGSLGEWGTVYKCEKGLLTGFQLRSEGNGGLRADNSAANNLRVTCSNPDIGSIQGDGMSWGSWGAEQHCASKQGICGLQTQVSWNVGPFADDVGLNNVKMLCCDIPYDISTCTPSDGWEQVVECDNIRGKYSSTCYLSKKRGLSIGQGYEHFVKEMEDVGFEKSIATSKLPKIFGQKIGKSNKTEHDWTEEPLQTWAKEETTKTQFNVQPAKLVRVYQAIGTCGPFVLRTTQFKKEEKDDPFR